MITKKEINLTELLEICDKYKQPIHDGYKVIYDVNFVDLVDEIADKIISQLPKLEMVEEGQVTQVNCYYEDGALIGDESVTDLLGEYENKKVRLYVEVIDANKNTR